MKGIVFSLLNDMVEEQFGLEAWDALITKAGSDGVYLSTETYSDEEPMRLVAAASELTGIAQTDLVKAFGQYMFPQFYTKYPVFFKPDMTLKSFLLTVDRVIHVEVRKLYPDAALPDFDYEHEEDDKLTQALDRYERLLRDFPFPDKVKGWRKEITELSRRIFFPGGARSGGSGI